MGVGAEVESEVELGLVFALEQVWVRARRESVWGLEKRAVVEVVMVMIKGRQRGWNRSQGGDYATVQAAGRMGAVTSWVTGVGERKTLEGSISSGRMVYYSFVALVRGLRWGSPPFRTQVQRWWGAEWRRWRNDGRRAFYDYYPICLRASACEETGGAIWLPQEGEQPNQGMEVRRRAMLPEQDPVGAQ